MLSEFNTYGVVKLKSKLLNILSVFLLLILILANSPLTGYTASARSGKYHTLDCEYAGKISDRNRKFFKSREIPEQQGFRPCAGCIPSPESGVGKNRLIH
jgi:hypothetical protein